MSVDLKKLAKRVDEALAKETPESLTKWLNERRQNADTGERQLTIPDVVWQSEQLKAFAEYLASRPDFEERSNKDLAIDYCDSL